MLKQNNGKNIIKEITFTQNNFLPEFCPICQQKSRHSCFGVLVWQIPKACLRHSGNSYSMFTLDGILFCNLYDHKNLYSHNETNFASCGYVCYTLGSKKVTFKHFFSDVMLARMQTIFSQKLQRGKIHLDLGIM